MNLNAIEKGLAWFVGLAAAVAGPLSAAKGLIPASVGTALVAVLPVLVAVERYVTNNTTPAPKVGVTVAPTVTPEVPPTVAPTVVPEVPKPTT